MEEKEVPGGLEMQGHSYKRRNAERDRPKKINEYIKKFVVTYRAPSLPVPSAEYN